MITADSSVLVAGFSTHHEFHELVQPHLAELIAGGRLISHTIAETYSVLSSPAGVFRAEPAAVAGYLEQFTEKKEPIGIDAALYIKAARMLADSSRGGGAIFDAVIALAARTAEATLLTIDSRAQPIYEACKASTRQLR